MKLMKLCDWLMQGRHRLLVPGLLLLSAPLWFLWRFLALILSSAALFCGVLFVMYHRAMQPMQGKPYARWPRPQDALAETVLVDASLLDDGTHLTYAAQPFEPVTELSLRMGSGTLLLGTAMTLTAAELPDCSHAAIVSAIRKLNIRSDQMRSRCPLLHREMLEDGVACLTVKDGVHQRDYMMGPPHAVSALCSVIWDGGMRPMTEEDRARIADSAALMQASSTQVVAYATALGDEPPMFLGLAAIGDDVHEDAQAQLSALRSMHLTVMLQEDDAHPVDMPLLRQLLDVPEIPARADVHLAMSESAVSPGCLTILGSDLPSLAEPVAALRQHFARLGAMLERLGLLLGSCLLLGVILNSPLGALAAFGMTAMILWRIGAPDRGRRAKLRTLLITAIGGVAARILLTGAPAEAMPFAGTLLCLVYALFAMWLLARYASPPQEAGKQAVSVLLGKLWPAVVIAVAAMALQALLSLSALPVVTAPALFCCCTGAVLGCLLLLGSR